MIEKEEIDEEEKKKCLVGSIIILVKRVKDICFFMWKLWEINILYL